MHQFIRTIKDALRDLAPIIVVVAFFQLAVLQQPFHPRKFMFIHTSTLLLLRSSHIFVYSSFFAFTLSSRSSDLVSPSLMHGGKNAKQRDSLALFLSNEVTRGKCWQALDIVLCLGNGVQSGKCRAKKYIYLVKVNN